MKNLIPEIQDNYQQIKKWRHDFHKHPELSFEEHRSAKKVAQYLKEMGVDEIHEGVGKTGVVGIIKNGEGPSIGLRGEMDALPIHEKSHHTYASKKANVMHACGHDGHVTMLLAAAQYLAKTRRFKGTVVLIFQPAEELVQGAPAMLKDGLLKRFPFESIYTMHSWPGASYDELFINSGEVMASVNNFDIQIKSSGGHAAMPQLCSDPILAGCQLINSLQSIVSRCAAPKDKIVLSCTAINAGSVYNVIPDSLSIKGTVRFFDEAMKKWVPEKMQQIIDGTALIHNVQITFDYRTLCPPTFNTNKESLLAKKVIKEMLGEQTGNKKAASMGSDDFCFYLEEVPGAYIFIGNGNNSAPLHHSAYDFNDEALVIGASFYAKLVEANQPLIEK